MSVPSDSSDRRQRRKRLATIEQVQLTHLPLPKSTLYDRARRGELPGVVRVGRRVLLDLDQLEAWIDQGGNLC